VLEKMQGPTAQCESRQQ